MTEDFFSFKVLIHDLQVNSHSLFKDQSYEVIEKPFFLMKLLDFPMMTIEGFYIKCDFLREIYQEIGKYQEKSKEKGFSIMARTHCLNIQNKNSKMNY